MLCVLVLLGTPISGTLTDPGQLCPGEMVTLTCDTTAGTAGTHTLTWIFDGVQLISIIPGSSTLPANRTESGVVFSISLLSAASFSFAVVSQISFEASSRSSGKTLECVGNGIEQSVSFQVETVVGKCVLCNIESTFLFVCGHLFELCGDPKFIAHCCSVCFFQNGRSVDPYAQHQNVCCTVTLAGCCTLDVSWCLPSRALQKTSMAISILNSARRPLDYAWRQ